MSQYRLCDACFALAGGGEEKCIGDLIPVEGGVDPRVCDRCGERGNRHHAPQYRGTFGKRQDIQWIEERADAVIEIDRVAVCLDQPEGYLSHALSPKGARELARRLLEVADYAESLK